MCYWPVSRVVLENPPKKKKKKEEEKKKPDHIMVSDQFAMQPIVSCSLLTSPPIFLPASPALLNTEHITVIFASYN